MENHYKEINFIGFLNLFRTEKRVKKNYGENLNDEWMSKPTGEFPHPERHYKLQKNITGLPSTHLLYFITSYGQVFFILRFYI